MKASRALSALAIRQRGIAQLTDQRGPPAGSCRACGATLEHTFVNLGMSPLANSYVHPRDRWAVEPFFPLHAWVCGHCLLVQLDEFESPERIFEDYAYFSSYSESWIRHAERFAESIVQRLGLDEDSLVVEPASNDGYLLQFFKRAGVPVLGIEPAGNVAEVARKKGIRTVVDFFGEDLARKIAKDGRPADLIVANNVLAHVPRVIDFVRGIKALLGPRGVATLEFPHLVELVERTQFDTIYHEHFSYFSFYTVRKVFADQGLTLFDVETLPTHGGSLRIYARHSEDSTKPISAAVWELVAREAARGYHRLERYLRFSSDVAKSKRQLLRFLIVTKEMGQSVVGYGAPAKGTVLLNYCGIGRDFLDYTTDVSPHKQGRLVPGVRIPIREPGAIFETKPDFVLILPWNLESEIREQMSGIGEWGGRFVTPIPVPTVRAADQGRSVEFAIGRLPA